MPCCGKDISFFHKTGFNIFRASHDARAGQGINHMPMQKRRQ